jgi:hypothetical protein
VLSPGGLRRLQEFGQHRAMPPMPLSHDDAEKSARATEAWSGSVKVRLAAIVEAVIELLFIPLSEGLRGITPVARTSASPRGVADRTVCTSVTFNAKPMSPIPIHLLSQRPNVSPDDLLALHDGLVIACDCYVAGAETWDEVPGGFASGRLVNVDHHAPVDRMARVVSSANLALERVRTLGPTPSDALIVITHTDCDSVLSAGIMAGRLPAEDRYGAAAIAADHTGEVNAIADLLQALDRRRDLEESFAMLARLEGGEPLPDDVILAIDRRTAEREFAAACVREGRVEMHGSVAAIVVAESVDGEFFAPLLPEAVVIAQFRPHDDDPSRLEVKLRLGRAAPAGCTLHALGISEFDPAYGGRWNAGSNRRAGGAAVSAVEYLRWLRTRVAASLQ